MGQNAIENKMIIVFNVIHTSQMWHQKQKIILGEFKGRVER